MLLILFHFLPTGVNHQEGSGFTAWGENSYDIQKIFRKIKQEKAMKCGCLIKREMRGKKKPKLKIVKQITRLWQRYAQDANVPEHLQIENDMELCDGEIIVSIRAVDEPDWGGSYATLELSYKCNKCGNCCFPELPQTPEEISSFVQTAVLRLSEE